MPLSNAAVFDQPYTYLGKGKQCFVFVSKDGKYVIKFPSNRYQKKIALHGFLSHIPFLNRWAKPSRLYFSQKLDKTFQSYTIAYQLLAEETALVYLHLQPTEIFQHPLKIIDKLGIAHPISLDKTAFILQKKADLVYPTLLSYKEHGNDIAAKKSLHSLLQLLKAKYSKGIFDNDSLVRSNFGILDGHAIQLDVGPFSLDASMATPENYLPEILKTTASLKKWISIHYPSLLPFLEEELENMIESDHF